MKRKIFIIIGLLVIAFLGFLFIKSKQKQPSFSVQTAQKEKMTVTVSTSGKVKAEEDVTLKFQTSGLLSWVGVKKGDEVKKYQAIASLDKRDLEKRFKKTMNNYLTQRWDFEQTQDDYKTTKERYLITDAIQRILDKEQFSLDNSVLDVEIADLAVKFATVYSPISGIVVNISQPFAGVNILVTEATFRIVDPKSMYFETQVDETDIGKIKEGDEASIALDAFTNETFTGKVIRIDFDSTVTSGGGTAYNTKISLPAEKFFRLGMSGDAEIVFQKLENVISVPTQSLVEKNEKNYVWKIEENDKLKLVEVILGTSNDTQTQITSGLSEGDKYISSNVNLAKEGMIIK